MQYQEIKVGDIIISSPHTENGAIFNKSVILIISHDKIGTSGVIVNKLISKIDAGTILKALDLPGFSGPELAMNLPVHIGGPVEPDRGIIIHSSEYPGKPLSKITPDISISADSRIIADILLHNGPSHKLMILGYAAWTPGQLMEEVKNNDWIILPDHNEATPNPNLKLIFAEENLYKWSSALKMSGVNLGNYSNLAGHA